MSKRLDLDAKDAMSLRHDDCEVDATVTSDGFVGHVRDFGKGPIGWCGELPECLEQSAVPDKPDEVKQRLAEQQAAEVELVETGENRTRPIASNRVDASRFRNRIEAPPSRTVALRRCA